ncbi:MAG: MtrB/PioB family decaheme-associated outer membrane protein [Gammaproteobacteria bacterium]
MSTFAAQLNRFLLAALLCAVYVPVFAAAPVDTSKWTCEYCPFEDGYRGDYDVGVTGVSDDSAYFGDASGYDESGAYINIDGDGSYKSESQQISWTLEDLGLDSRFAEIEGGNQGAYDYRIAYREIPRRRFFTTESIFRETGSAELSLPSGWVRAGNTEGFSELDSSLVGRNIESDRSIFEIGGRYLQSKNISFSADFSRQERDGVDIFGGPFFFQSSLLPGQIDYTTDAVDLGVQYSAESGYLTFGWRLSEFDNDNLSLRWENPFTNGFGADSGELSQAPDNTFQQLSLSGAYRVAQLRTVLGFSAAAGRLEQNDTLLPYTTNAGLGAGAPPVSNLDARVNTTNLALTANSYITSRATVRASFRYDERDNRTQQYVWTRAITDSFLSGESETNTPYSYERSTFSLSGEYELFDSLRASAGYDYKQMDRDNQEVSEQTENGGWGRLRWQANSALAIDARGGASQRTNDFYDETLAGSLGQNPLLRKYNLAYRYRTYGEVTATVAPYESPFSLTLNGFYAEDDYGRSTIGLLNGDDLSLNADLGWAASETVSVYLSGGYQNIESTQAGSEQFADPDWTATNDDTFYTLGAGLRIREIADKLDLQLDYTRSDGTSEIDVDSASGGFSQLPDLTSTLDYLRLKLAYRYSDRTEITTRLVYQSFSADDWALQGVEPATIPNVLSLGAEPYDDDQFIVGIGFRYRIGEAAAASE